MELPQGLAPYYAKQEEIATQVIKKDELAENIEWIAGADVAYDDAQQEMVGAIVILDPESLQIIEQVTHRMPITFPYVPGLFSFRETPVLIAAFQKLERIPQLLICDGHGIAHPKQAGMASHLGVELNIPTIGCAKKRLTGSFDKTKLPKARGSQQQLILDGQLIGTALRTQDNIKAVFVSIGHKVSLPTAVDWVLKVSPNYRLPETTRAADHLVNQSLKNFI